MKTEKVRLSSLRFDNELMTLRPINSYIVNKYRQNYRSGAQMPPPIIDVDDMVIVSGNHRVMAMIGEYGEDAEVSVQFKKYESRLDLLNDFVAENASHGYPLDGISKRSIAIAMSKEGADHNDIAAAFDVSVKRIDKWCGFTVIVTNGKKKQAMPIKRGPNIAGSIISKAQYDTHIQRDRAVPAFSQAQQLSRWLRDGWIDNEDVKTVTALSELRDDIADFLASCEVSA